MAEAIKRYPVKCDECGKGMDKGYYADGQHYCDTPCLHANITEAEWDELYEEGGDHYYTEWDESTFNGGFYDADGNWFPFPSKDPDKELCKAIRAASPKWPERTTPRTSDPVYFNSMTQSPLPPYTHRASQN